MEPRPRRLTRTTLALLALLLTLLAAEGLARLVFAPPVVNTSMVADPLLGYRLPRNIDWQLLDERGSFRYRLNSEGFPGPELPAEGAAPPEGERILLVGDSFLNPWLIREEEWVGSVLRDELRALGPEPEVFAVTSDDYGTAQELLLLRRYGRRVAPTTVVLLVFPYNDVINNSPELAGRTQVSPGDYFRPYLVDDGDGTLRLRYAQPWKAWLRRTRLFSVIESRWLSRFGVAAELQEELSGVPVLKVEERIRANLLPEESLEIFRAPVQGGAWEHAWKATESLLLAFQREVEGLGARFLVVTIPCVLQIQGLSINQFYDRLLHSNGKPSLRRQLDWNWPEGHLEAFFHRNGIAHVQMLDPLRRALYEGPLYRKDGHLNGHGHVLMGQRLAARLQPGAVDECFSPEEHTEPVELSRLYPDESFELDLSTRPCMELVGGGWGSWRPPGNGTAGWPLEAHGQLIAPNRRGRLILRGELLPGNPFPVTLKVSITGQRTIAKRALETPGEFLLTLPMWRRRDHEDWIPLVLSLEGRSEVRGALVLTGMSFYP